MVWAKLETDLARSMPYGAPKQTKGKGLQQFFLGNDRHAFRHSDASDVDIGKYPSKWSTEEGALIAFKH